MEEFFSNLVSSIGLNDILDILITAFVFYKIMEFIKDNRAQQLLKGLLIIVAGYFVSVLLNLHVVKWLLGGAFTVGVFAVVVLFQPELRRGLEHMGRSRLGRNRLLQMDKEKAENIVDEITKTVVGFSEARTGALLIFEGEITLEDIAETGTIINADITSELLGNLFYVGSPLHDGAVIIRQDKVYAAGCVLPLSENNTLSKSMGTRHRAGLGITENSDALAIIVSEENGVISMAENGNITRYLEKKDLNKVLLSQYLDSSDDKTSTFDKISEKLGRGRHASK